MTESSSFWHRVLTFYDPDPQFLVWAALVILIWSFVVSWLESRSETGR